MVRSRGMAWVLALVLAGVVLIGTVALAADPELKVGVVDVEKVYKDAPRLKQYTEELNKYREGLGRKLELRSQNMMLSEEEVKELIDLSTKEGANDKDTARIKALKDAERAKDDELKQLQGTKDLKDQDKARLNELQAIRKKSEDTGTALTKDYDGLLQSKMQEVNGKAETEVRDAITKVASAKGLTLVVAKEAVLFGGNDVTDKVIDELSRK
ncbi:MAG: OmpH family outer membrane protein [Armatimonadetes bacterium]|nr:OmpH family outer membrane protein [Armatimonadota bacterium]